MNDRAFSAAVRSAQACERCGGVPGYDYLECAHVYPKRFTTVRHDFDNALCLCRQCHGWAHAHPKEFQPWFALTFPDRLERLAEKTGVRLKWDSMPSPNASTERSSDGSTSS